METYVPVPLKPWPLYIFQSGSSYYIQLHKFVRGAKKNRYPLENRLACAYDNNMIIDHVFVFTPLGGLTFGVSTPERGIVMKRIIVIIPIVIFAVLVGPTVADYPWVFLDDGNYHLVDDFTYQSNEVSLDEYTVNSPGTHLELVDGGLVGGFIAGHNNSRITVSGGDAGGLWGGGNSFITMTDGMTYWVVLVGTSVAELSGGTLGGDLEGCHDSYIDVIGCSVSGSLRVEDNSLMVLHGFFSVGGQFVQNGDSLKDYGTMTANQERITGTITGKLKNGTALNNSFSITLDPYGMLFDSDIIVQWPSVELLLLAPNGGESYYAGQQIEIQWTQDEYFQDVILEYSVNSGSDWTVIDTVSATEGTNSYPWTVPEENSQNCLIRISDAAEPYFYDQNSYEFTIYICILEYDTNGDCQVNLLDLARLSSEWLQSGNPFEI